MNALLRWKVLACLVVVSLTSGFIGGTLALWWPGKRTPSQQAGAPSSESTGALYVRHLRSYLSLDEEQTRKVQASFDRARAEMETGGNGSLRAVGEARRRMQEGIRGVLTPEQLTRFNRLDQLRGRALRGPRDATSQEASEKPPPAAKEQGR